MAASGGVLRVSGVPALTVVIPTFNEAGNIRELLRQLTESLSDDGAGNGLGGGTAGYGVEVIFVDDSTDETPAIIRQAALTCPFPMTVIHREDREGGLGGAVVEGLRAAAGEWVVVMDADLQHPPSLAGELVATGVRSGADVVVATRYSRGGRSDGLDGRYRMLVSRMSTRVTKALFPRRLRGISDPMSGFFAIRRAAVRPETLRPHGYKILLELVVRSRLRRRAEVPYVFGPRFAGDSKSSVGEGLKFLRHLATLRVSTPWLPRVALLAVVATIAVLRPGPWLTLTVLLLAGGFARAAGWHGRQLRVIVLALGVTVSAIDYLAWRMSVLNWSLPGVLIGVPLLLAELHAAAHTVGLQVTVWPVEHRRPHAHNPHVARPVYVFIPTVDEGPEIVGETVRGVLAARDAYRAVHPDREITVVVCNDGGVAGAACSDALIACCAELGVECITRTVKGGAKAGNIEHARQLVGATGDALIAIFDADQIPRQDFFLRTLHPFNDPTIGWVQTGQFYGNRDNPVARWADDQQSLFYRLLCPGKAAHDSAFICGTNVVLRAAALDEIGGLPTDSVTEDFAASLQLAPRWRSVYLPGVLAVGLGPADLPAFLKQQERWARGTLHGLRTGWRELVLPRREGLRPQQRLQYGLAVTHYLCGVRDLVFAVAPVLFLLTGLSGVRGATLGDFFMHFLPYYMLAVLAFVHAARGTTSWRAIVIGYGSFPSLVRAAWMTLVGTRGLFTITPKARSAASPWRSAWPHLAVFGSCLLALAVGLTRHRSPAYWLADFWLLYLCGLTGLHLWLVHQDAEAAKAVPSPVRVARQDPVPLELWRHRRRFGFVFASLLLVTACSVGASATLSGATAASGRRPVIVPGRTAVGVSGTKTSHVARLQLEMGTSFGLQGRTLEIGAQFDTDWADQVVAQGGTPWLTLVLSKNGRITLNSGLTAIANGVDDVALERWAKEIASFGRPLYLTMLPEVDRNYPATSAVSNGGIPEDVPRAWRHLREVFATAGARNLDWVWSPADPANDRVYSPPPDQIDVVSMTMFEYPGTTWVKPERELAAVEARHPGKPLLIEAATAGQTSRRVSWIFSLQSAIRARRDVAGLVYQDSGPIDNVDNPAALPWSMSANPEFQTAMRTVFVNLTGAAS